MVIREYEGPDKDPAAILVDEAVLRIGRKGTRKNRVDQFEDELDLLIVSEDDTLETRLAKIRASTTLRKRRDDILDEPWPDSPNLDLHRGSRQMRIDPAGPRK